jgi:hypothetical protein
LCVPYPHLFYTNNNDDKNKAAIARLFCIVHDSLPPVNDVLTELQQALTPSHGEAHANKRSSDDHVQQAQLLFQESGLDMVSVNATEYVGDVCHEKGASVFVEEFEKTKKNSCED